MYDKYTVCNKSKSTNGGQKEFVKIMCHIKWRINDTEETHTEIFVEEHTKGTDDMTIDELEKALKTTKNRKGTGSDGLDSELLIYEGLFL